MSNETYTYQPSAGYGTVEAIRRGWSNPPVEMITAGQVPASNKFVEKRAETPKQNEQHKPPRPPNKPPKPPKPPKRRVTRERMCSEESKAQRAKAMTVIAELKIVTSFDLSKALNVTVTRAAQLLQTLKNNGSLIHAGYRKTPGVDRPMSLFKLAAKSES